MTDRKVQDARVTEEATVAGQPRREPAPVQSSERLEAIGKTIGLLLIFLPAIGAFTRVVAFYQGGLGNQALSAAVRAPLSDLMMIGVLIALLAGTLVAEVAFLNWTRPFTIAKLRRLGEVAVGMRSWVRWPAAIGLLILMVVAPIAALLATVLLLPGWPLNLAGVVGAALTVALFEAAIRRGPARWSRLWLSLVPGIAAGVLLFGLSGAGAAVSVGHYRFAAPSAAAIADGTYVEVLSEANGMLWLVGCDPGSPPLLRVPVAMVVSMVPELKDPGPDWPSLWSVLFDDGEMMSFGLHASWCGP
jgi:hypothetical protein